MKWLAWAAMIFAGGCERPSAPTGVSPGTALQEDEFLPALKATGARFIVISVFAADCGPCLTESLQLMGRREGWRTQGVEILGLGMGKSPEDVRRFLKQTGDRVAFPLYFAPWFAERQVVEATPTLFIYSAAGERLFRADGLEHEDLPKLADEKLRHLLARSKSS